MRNFLRIFVRERNAFAASIWIGFVAGVAVIVLGIYIRFYMMAFLIAWYLWMNWQQWQYFRKHGYPGD